ncbi:VWA domain-containing protein [Actinokineospora sp. 24-640]
MTEFDIAVDQNAYLPLGGRTMYAAVSVTLRGAPRQARPASAAQVLMLDCSGSMWGAKLAQAKAAAIAAVDTLRDGTAFAIVAGTESAWQVYPEHGMAAASGRSRAEARKAVRAMSADGGTAIGAWLRLAGRLLENRTEEIKHGLLLTDGRNEHQTPEQLAAAIAACAGHFVCDCRGVGDGWEATPLLAVADALSGSAMALTDPAGLAEEFRAITAELMGKSLGQVVLRLWTPARATVRFVKQVFPRLVDLTGSAVEVSARVREYPTGHWGEESRDFHVCVEVPAGEVDEEMAAARVSMAVDGLESAQRTVWAHWVDDPALSTRIDAKVAHLMGQQELAEAIDAGLAARQAGMTEEAGKLLGRARELAERTGHETLAVLGRIVEVDQDSGTVRVRPDMAAIDAEVAALTSRRTRRVRGQP